MAVELPGAALRACSTPEPDIPDHAHETFNRELKKGVLFLCECGNAVGDGDEGNDNHRCVRMGRAARDIVFVPFRGLQVISADPGIGLNPSLPPTAG